jgi:hypothetical protein
MTMKTITHIFGMITLVFMLAGCGGAPVDSSRLRPPPAWAMEAPCMMPKITADEANPAVRIGYYTQSRQCHARTRDQVRGLQRYVHTIRRS